MPYDFFDRISKFLRPGECGRNRDAIHGEHLSRFNTPLTCIILS